MEWLCRLGHWGFSFEFALKKQVKIHKKKKSWEQTPGGEGLGINWAPCSRSFSFPVKEQGRADRRRRPSRGSLEVMYKKRGRWWWQVGGGLRWCAEGPYWVASAVVHTLFRPVFSHTSSNSKAHGIHTRKHRKSGSNYIWLPLNLLGNCTWPGGKRRFHTECIGSTK